jgi:adenosylcobinamide-phosphate synthase
MEYWILSTIFIALLIDLIIGEPPVSIHPVVWIGNLIQILKNYLIKIPYKLSGFILTTIILLIFLLPLIYILYLLQYNTIILLLVSAGVMSTTFSIKFLIKSSQDISHLIQTDLEKTRQSVSYLVSRDTSKLSESQLVSATVESLTENITDSVIAPLFYAFIFGVPGAVAYRVVNTLDAMVGYKNPENRIIGWFPAKFDDVLNYIPARITGILVVMAAMILGMNWRNSYRIMIRDARKTPSPNSGYSMAAAAGALEIRLEKPGVYQLGDNKSVDKKLSLDYKTILNAIKLTKVTIILFVFYSSLIFLLIWFLIGRTIIFPL